MDSTFRALMAAHGPLNIEDLDTDPATGYPLALDGLPILPDVEPDPLAGYPFEVTLPLWRLPEREAGSECPGVPVPPPCSPSPRPPNSPRASPTRTAGTPAARIVAISGGCA